MHGWVCARELKAAITCGKESDSLFKGCWYQPNGITHALFWQFEGLSTHWHSHGNFTEQDYLTYPADGLSEMRCARKGTLSRSMRETLSSVPHLSDAMEAASRPKVPKALLGAYLDHMEAATWPQQLRPLKSAMRCRFSLGK